MWIIFVFVRDLDCSLALCLLEGRYFWEYVLPFPCQPKKYRPTYLRLTGRRKQERLSALIISVKRILQHSGFCRGPLGKPSVVYYLSMFVSFMVTSLGTIIWIAPMNSIFKKSMFCNGWVLNCLDIDWRFFTHHCGWSMSLKVWRGSLMFVNHFISVDTTTHKLHGLKKLTTSDLPFTIFYWLRGPLLLLTCPR